MGNTETGKIYSVVMGIYIIVKAVLNMILGNGFSSLILPILMAIVLFIGIKYGNYAIAIVLGITVLMHIGTNVSNLGLNRYLIYFIEGIIDIVCAILLVINKDIKAYFDTSMSNT
ncbi:MAG: hypothetical protein ACI4WH_02660 [Oscillospiraceae bacterium]